jgi:hypothetical protein
MTAVLQYAVVGAIVGGICAGVAGGILAGRWLALRIVNRSSLSSIAKASPYAGAALAAIPSLVLSFVVGGNLGGGWGEEAFGAAGVPFGIFVGIGLVLATGVAVGYLFGAFLASVGTKSPRHEA